ncbi:MAG: DUF192 domain-containing protein [Rhodobacteraceae bacterium]|nr:DUF192 domain-containing protein [Paracoccaceae bacterium]
MGRLLAAVAVVVGALAASATLAASTALDACRDDVVRLRGDWGQAQFQVELADDAESRATGLMHRLDLAHGAGMLFIYPQAQPVAFWMRNTLIELDMVFIDSRGRVLRVHPRAQPLDETPIPSGGAVRFVLEIRGGLAHSLGIAPGSEMQHPAIPLAQAVWPCPLREGL